MSHSPPSPSTALHTTRRHHLPLSGVPLDTAITPSYSRFGAPHYMLARPQQHPRANENSTGRWVSPLPNPRPAPRPSSESLLSPFCPSAAFLRDIIPAVSHRPAASNRLAQERYACNPKHSRPPPPPDHNRGRRSSSDKGCSGQVRRATQECLPSRPLYPMTPATAGGRGRRRCLALGSRFYNQLRDKCGQVSQANEPPKISTTQQSPKAALLIKDEQNIDAPHPGLPLPTSRPVLHGGTAWPAAAVLLGQRAETYKVSQTLFRAHNCSSVTRTNNNSELEALRARWELLEGCWADDSKTRIARKSNENVTYGQNDRCLKSVSVTAHSPRHYRQYTRRQEATSRFPVGLMSAGASHQLAQNGLKATYSVHNLCSALPISTHVPHILHHQHHEVSHSPRRKETEARGEGRREYKRDSLNSYLISYLHRHHSMPTPDKRCQNFAL
ncbi:hypothetical protein O3P69_004095 [Scylla paramamosain]|uniref:Uncharacterized protein n=1 Tax=Scylla paramamosain TaxID=85552 RepID=A0AAW0UG28_SCYPA